jgi:hypothetical protein
MLSLLVVGTSSLSTPVWPNQFAEDFTEIESYGSAFVKKTNGTFYYDWTNERYKVTRQNGQGDRYCGTVEKFVATPCNHYVVDGKRYLDFPDKKYCCFCCDKAHGCGVLTPNWLQTATNNGTEVINGTSYQRWFIEGLQPNYYYETTGANRVMKRITQGKDDIMDFDPATLRTKVDESDFKLPSYCNSTCGATTICAGLRG